ncbi:MAG: helix-turn-helix domain-containing protein [Trichocoleus desertorum ATA4-8-CV12]|nr:helix-turn-helix domain-containing protein [Trichocoleus desertorum ATA4-8-CV12]
MTAQQPSLITRSPLHGEKLESLLHQMARMNGRINRLYEAANVPAPDPIELLPTAFKELGVASEELQVAIEELQQQNQELLRLQNQLSAERDRYREIFESAPDIYLITSFDGIIQEANRAAASLLNVAQRFLVGKPLFSFIPSEHRLAFRQKLLQIQQVARSQECKLTIQPREADGFIVTATVSIVTSPGDELCCLQWLIRRLPDGMVPQTYLPNHGTSPSDLPIHKYVKGELIPCKLEAIWQVQQGLVKLNTFSENGEEVFIGIAGPSLPFGPGLTSLQTYQATALTDEVKLVSIAWQDIAARPELAQSLLSRVSQRLQQTERFLSVCGQRRVQDRLHHFLRLLKQEVGQPVSNGTRIQVRLTHEDLANACCTTRVTVTRILGKLQQQGKITLDPKHYIILHDDQF